LTAETPAPTKREINLRVFEGKDYPGVFWQPRAEPWFAWHREFGTMPERYAQMSLLDFFDDFDLSMRYVHYYTGMPDPVARRYTEPVKVDHQREGERGVTVIHTPHGDLVEKHHLTVDRTWRTVEFPVKTRQDLKGLKWLLERSECRFVPERFEKGSAFVGDRGEPQFWVPKSPYQALCQQYMKLHDFIYALADAPDEVEEVMDLIDRTYDPLYEQLAAYGGAHIINFGENVHESLLSPAYFERYLMPWYEKRAGQLHAAGIYSHMHLDGYFKSLLPFLARMPFDGIEALTPKPQGDVTLEQIKDHIGDKVLLDGIPAIFFLPHYPQERVQECVERLVELFHPRLVLGISDELPEGADEAGVERMRWVGEYCRNWGG
jgi:hypothetical protein